MILRTQRLFISSVDRCKINKFHNCCNRFNKKFRSRVVKHGNRCRLPLLQQSVKKGCIVTILIRLHGKKYLWETNEKLEVGGGGIEWYICTFGIVAAGRNRRFTGETVELFTRLQPRFESYGNICLRGRTDRGRGLVQSVRGKNNTSLCSSAHVYQRLFNTTHVIRDESEPIRWNFLRFNYAINRDVCCYYPHLRSPHGVPVSPARVYFTPGVWG